MKKLIFILSLMLVFSSFSNYGHAQFLAGGLGKEKVKKEKVKKEKSDKSKKAFNSMQEIDALMAENEAELAKLIDMSDPQYEWTQFDTKNASAILTEKGLTLKNKKDESVAMSIVELPFNYDEDNFTYLVTTTVGSKKIDNDKCVGLVFDYSDNRNYKAILINSSQYSYVNIKDGVEHIIKTGLLKLPEKYFTMWIKRNGDVIYFYINDIEFAKINNVKFDSPYFGVVVKGKEEATFTKFMFEIDQKEESEQSTELN